MGIVGMNPNVAQALFQRAFESHRRGRPDEALPVYEVLLRHLPAEPELRRLIGAACLDLGRREDAIGQLRVCLALAPGHAMALSGLGSALRSLGHVDVATVHMRRATVAEPGHTGLLTNLAFALVAIGAGIEAAAALGSVVRAGSGGAEIDAALAEALTQASDLHRQAGRRADAVASVRRALTLAPSHAGAWRVLAASLVDGAEPRTAALRAVRAAPDDSTARTVLGLVEMRQGLAMATERNLEVALALAPSSAEAHNNMGVALLASRHPERALRSLRRAQAIRGGTGVVGSNDLLALNYHPGVGDDELAEAHRRWGMAALAAARRRSPPPCTPRGQRRLRLGYVSPDFKRHPVGYLIAGLLENHDHARFAVHCYSDVTRPDDMTHRLKACADVWHDTAALSDGALGDLIEHEGIDILIDLAGHTAGNRLAVFAERPAPVQVSWLGYFHTTGLPTIAAVLTDAASVPPAMRRWFVEQVVPLRQGRFCYTPPRPCPPVAPPPLLTAGRPMFGSFNNVSKLSPGVLDLWGELLRRIPAAGLTLKWHTLAEEDARRAIRAAFDERGIDPARLRLLGPSDHWTMLEEYAGMDVALDPFPFNGCLTTLEALWMGVPVVTPEGARPVARQSLAILRRIGAEDLVAGSEEEYLRIAEQLITDPDGLARRRSAMRALMEARICDGAAFAKEFEAALLALWHTSDSDAGDSDRPSPHHG